MLMSIDPSAMNSPTAKSSESPGRIGKSSPHSMKTMAALTQKNWRAEALEQPLRVHPVGAEGGGHHRSRVCRAAGAARILTRRASCGAPARVVRDGVRVGADAHPPGWGSDHRGEVVERRGEQRPRRG